LVAIAILIAGSCYYWWTTKISLLRLTLWIALFGFWGASSNHLHAQSVSAVFSGPQNMDQGLQNGLNNITGYVYSILKFLSLIGLGVAYYFVTHHGVGKAILGDDCGGPALVCPGRGQHRGKSWCRRRPAIIIERGLRRLIGFAGRKWLLLHPGAWVSLTLLQIGP
jgi:hypothetical protein